MLHECGVIHLQETLKTSALLGFIAGALCQKQKMTRKLLLRTLNDSVKEPITARVIYNPYRSFAQRTTLKSSGVGVW